MAERSKLRIELLGVEHADEVPLAYIPVFTGHPWHEEFACSCGAKPFSMGCGHNDGKCEEFRNGVTLIRSPEQRCGSCDQLLEQSLVPYYTHSSVKEDFLGEFRRQGFLGAGAFKFGKLVGLCWGFDFPLDHPPKTGSVWYHEVAPLIEMAGAVPSRSFYHTESGTLPEFQNQGIGTALLRRVLEDTAKLDKDWVTFRTINPGMVRCYEKVFGLAEGSIQASFNDPNTSKRQKWYVLPLKK